MRDWYNIISGFRRYMPRTQLSQDKLEAIFMKHGFIKSGSGKSYCSPVNSDTRFGIVWFRQDGTTRFTSMNSKGKIVSEFLSPFTWPSGSPEKDYRFLTEVELDEFLTDVIAAQKIGLEQEYNNSVNEALAKLD